MLLYIHIPFCKSKCAYCDFNSYACQSEALIFSYLTALNCELRYAGSKFSNAKIDSVYIGGGTPSMLEAKDIERICKTVKECFKLKDNCEYTIECNPESIDEEKLVKYKEFGINRISIGVQSLEDRNLKSMGRLHTAQMAIEKIQLANNYFDNVSCDLIIGLPYDTVENVKEEVSILSKLVKHISMYELTIEQNTPLAKRIDEEKVLLPDDDEMVELFDVAMSVARDNGLHRYEVSNFALDGYYSRHNYGYWARDEYIGIGAGAHSLVKTSDGVIPLVHEIRFSSPKDINAYIAGINCVRSFDDVPRMDMNVLNDSDLINEEIMLGLRTTKGVKKHLIMHKITPDIKDFFNIGDEYVSLNDRGISVMNSILVKLMVF